jgi:SAM-dependent methyltransferase
MTTARAQDLLQRLYAGYYERDAASPLVSSHWKPHCDQFTVDFERMRVSGDGFGLPTGLRPARVLLEWLCIASYFTWLPNRRRMLSLLSSGLRVSRRMDVPFVWGSFRQLCALELMTRYAKDPSTILVIGDGYGFLSAMLKELYPKARIVLIDLGKTLLFQVFHVTKAFPGAGHALAGEGDGDFVYCPADQIDRLPFAYDLAINTHSMQEMTMATVARYFEFLRAHVRPDNLFYCCNRESKTLPDGEVIAFANYPWSDKDQHLVDERPAFYKYFVTGTFPYFTSFTGKSRHRLTRLAVSS